MTWLAGFDRIDAGRDGGSWARTDLPWRGVIHTTEGASIAGAVAAYRKNGTPPHFTVDPVRLERAQHIPLDRAAYALKNMPGGVETNRVPCIQIEIVGYAGQTHLWPAERLDWLGDQVLKPIMERVPIGVAHPKFVGEEDGTIARDDAPQRLSYAAWEKLNGWCGHQHVPENHHWDPGRIDLTRVLRAAVTGQPSQEADEVKLKQYRAKDVGDTYSLDGKTWKNTQIWICGEHRRPASTPERLGELIAAGQVDPTTYPMTLGAIGEIPRAQ